jgi:hypothetical protein
MTKRVYVTRAQTRAAKTLVRRSAQTGRFVSVGVKKIAQVRSTNGDGARSTQTGKITRSK